MQAHIYLHHLTKKFNKFYSNPRFVKEVFDKKMKNEAECVLMPSGSSWSKEHGFKLKNMIIQILILMLKNIILKIKIN